MNPPCLDKFVGREATICGIVTPEMASNYRQLLDIRPPTEASSDYAHASLGLLWCIQRSGKGNVGVSSPLIPEFSGYQRLWASSDVQCFQSVQEYSQISQTSRIVSADVAAGGAVESFSLVLSITYAAGKQPLAYEMRRLVYQNPWTKRPNDRKNSRLESPENSRKKTIEINESILQRYSTLTSNQNPVHTNLEYCKRHGFPGLIIHAPLQASLLLHFLEEQYPGLFVRHFHFRPTRPLYHPSPFDLLCREDNGVFHMSIRSSDGVTTMTANCHVE